MSDVLQKEFGYVFLGLFSTVIANFYLVGNVSKLRRKHGISYPATYASEEHIDGKKCKAEDVVTFNCAQRAHANTCESIGMVRLAAVMNALAGSPKLSGALLGVYAIGRIVYGKGYVSNGPKGRLAGSIISHLADIPLYLMLAYNGAKLLDFV